MIDAEGNPLKFAGEALVRHHTSSKDKQNLSSETNFYRFIKNSEARKNYIEGMKIKLMEFLYRMPRII